MKTSLMFWMQRILAALPRSFRAQAPYVLMGLFMPGGSLLAPLLDPQPQIGSGVR